MTDKQEQERRIIESARKRSDLFPPGTLEMDDAPDGRIPSAALGIEVSWLPREKSEGASFSPFQLVSFQGEVVREAARLFPSVHAGPADVLVYFDNDWDRRRDVREMGRALADFVANNYPQQSEAVCLQKGPLAVGWVDGVSVVRIFPEGGTWQASGCRTGVCARHIKACLSVFSLVNLSEPTNHIRRWQRGRPTRQNEPYSLSSVNSRCLFFRQVCKYLSAPVSLLVFSGSAEVRPSMLRNSWSTSTDGYRLRQ